jgi:serine/threonine-protein kinase
LYAVPFDVERLEFRGKAEAVLDEVAQALTGGNTSNLTGAGQFAVAATGTLAWVPGAVAPYPDRTLVTVDRRGQVTPLPAPAKSYAGALRRSPDGRHLAVIVETLGGCGLWIYDLGRGTLTPRTVEGEVSWTAGWSPDGQRVLFLWLRDGRWLLAAQPADGTASPQVLVPGEFNPSSVTPDGRQVIGVSGGDIVSAAIERGTWHVQPVMQTPHAEGWPALSPDGRWLAYGSNVSGRPEVYVQPYSAQGSAEVVSLAGGDSPAWHPNGRELFFLSLQDQAGKRRMMAVDFAAGPPPRIGRPYVLFQFDNRDLRLACTPLRCYDVAPDGQRFYGVQSHTPPPTPVVTHINLILNWFEELKAKVPAGGAK